MKSGWTGWLLVIAIVVAVIVTAALTANGSLSCEDRTAERLAGTFLVSGCSE